MNDSTFNDRMHALHLKYVAGTEGAWRVYKDALNHAREVYDGSTGDVMIAQDECRIAILLAGEAYDRAVEGPRAEYEDLMDELRAEYEALMDERRAEYRAKS